MVVTDETRPRTDARRWAGRRPDRRAAAEPTTTRDPARGGLALAMLLVLAFAIRLVGIRHGLPYAFNPDEEGHFVPPAADAADGDWDPDYYENPAALTYLLSFVFRIVFWGRDRTDLLTSDPGAMFLVARVVVAVLGTLVVYLVFRAGREFADRQVGLIAAAVMAFAFLPVYYSHQALNDVPTLLGVTLALTACLRLYADGRLRDVLLAGAGVGLAAGTKYLAAPLCLVVALVVVLRLVERRESLGRAAGLLAGSGVACVLALVALNPFLVLEFADARSQFLGQSAQAGTPKLGQVGAAWSTYPLTLLWGLGVVPLAMALVGVVRGVRRAPRRTLLLVAFPVVLYLYMAGQERFFGRWMLPMYPALCVLAGYGVQGAARRLGALLRLEGDRASRLLLGGLVAITLAQPVVDSVRSDLVLSREYTLTEAEEWVSTRLDADDGIVVEPSVPATYLAGDDAPARYLIEPPYQAYESRLTPALIQDYRDAGFCWVVVNSHQRDRGLSAGLAGARAYYDTLEDESRLAALFTPYREGAEPPDFSFDFSFNWYPTAYRRPGPLVEIRELDDCTAPVTDPTGEPRAQDATG